MSAVVAPTGKGLLGDVVDWGGGVRWLLTAGPVVCYRVQWTTGSCRSTATSMTVERGWSGFTVRRAI